MRIVRPMERAVYIVTDIECDGPTPGRNSMIAFASVAVTADGAEQGRFEAVLEPLPGAGRDPQTWAWWNAQPNVLAAATEGARPAGEVMEAFAGWVRGFPDGRVFTAFPLAFDGGWIDHYLRRFTSSALVPGHFEEDPLFDGPGLCLKAYAAGITGLPPWRCTPQALPAAWFGGHEHTHRAIDDALGYAALLGNLTREAAARAPS